MRRRSLGLSVCVAMLFAVVVAGCAGSRGGPEQSSGRLVASHSTTRVMRYRDPLGWALYYPGDFHLEHSRSPSFISFVSVDEVTVASFAMRSPIHAHHSETGASMRVFPPQNSEGVFPADGIAFRVFHQGGGPGPNLEPPESHFPLRLSSFDRSTAFGSTKPPALERSVIAEGDNFTIEAWIGPKASTGRRERLQEIVSSLAFPRLHVGQTVGSGFQVFARATHYPVGSFTRVRVQGQPFYLVHAPGGWYAVGWTWESLEGGYKSRCRLQFNAAAKQFFCTNMRARWDRVGRVIVKPGTAGRGDPLNHTIAKVAWDGHVLITAGVARFADASNAHRLWPSTHDR